MKKSVRRKRRKKQSHETPVFLEPFAEVVPCKTYVEAMDLEEWLREQQRDRLIIEKPPKEPKTDEAFDEALTSSAQPCLTEPACFLLSRKLTR